MKVLFTPITSEQSKMATMDFVLLWITLSRACSLVSLSAINEFAGKDYPKMFCTSTAYPAVDPLATRGIQWVKAAFYHIPMMFALPLESARCLLWCHNPTSIPPNFKFSNIYLSCLETKLPNICTANIFGHTGQNHSAYSACISIKMADQSNSNSAPEICANSVRWFNDCM